MFQINRYSEELRRRNEEAKNNFGDIYTSLPWSAEFKAVPTHSAIETYEFAFLQWKLPNLESSIVAVSAVWQLDIKMTLRMVRATLSEQNINKSDIINS